MTSTMSLATAICSIVSEGITWVWIFRSFAQPSDVKIYARPKRFPNNEEIAKAWCEIHNIDEDEEEDYVDAVRYKIWSGGATWMKEETIKRSGN